MFLRDDLAKKMGCVICPLLYGIFTLCDEQCVKCQLCIDFIEFFKNKE